jgi:hypothetical protein
MTDREKLRAALAELQGFLGDRATDAAMHRMAYSRDWSPRYKDMTDLPDIVVVPHDTGEVIQIVQVALRYELSVVPFAGGTGMGGGAVAWKGGIMIETKGMNKVLEIDPDNMSVTVQAGITIWELTEHLAAPSAGEQAGLHHRCQHRLRQRLDLRRPLWQDPGLPDRRRGGDWPGGGRALGASQGIVLVHRL